MSGASSDDRRARDRVVSKGDTADPTQVLGGPRQFPTATDHAEDLQTRVAVKVNVPGEPDVIAPTVLFRDEAAQDARRIVTIQ
ncbi:MAG: hypothetical protein LVQ64_04145 [Thermoplasmatales archaeon]|nr:hypothetical protein [Thermoplasmatales archaeon]